MKDAIVKLVGSAVIFIGVGCLIAVLMAVPLMLLWNCLVPAIFGIALFQQSLDSAKYPSGRH